MEKIKTKAEKIKTTAEDIKDIAWTGDLKQASITKIQEGMRLLVNCNAHWFVIPEGFTPYVCFENTQISKFVNLTIGDIIEEEVEAEISFDSLVFFMPESSYEVSSTDTAYLSRLIGSLLTDVMIAATQSSLGVDKEINTLMSHCRDFVKNIDRESNGIILSDFKKGMAAALAYQYCSFEDESEYKGLFKDDFLGEGSTADYLTLIDPTYNVDYELQLCHLSQVNVGNTSPNMKVFEELMAKRNM